MSFKAGVYLLLFLSLATIGFLAIEAGNPGWPSSRSYAAICEQDPARCTPLAFTQDTSAREHLAAAYAPVVYLPDFDEPCTRGGTSFAPMSVNAILNNPEVRLRKLSDPGFVKAAPSSIDLWLDGGTDYFDTYVDLPGRPADPGCRYESDALRFTSDGERTAYARIVTDEDGGGLFLQYWLFYYFNDWNNRHEADWELIQLHFDADSPEEAITLEPTSVALSQHRSGEVAAWADTKLRREGSHPVVYAALGSHANYFRPGLYAGRGEAGRGLGCDDASNSERRMALDATLLPDRILGSGDEFAWLAFKGFWGEADRPGFEGSTSPTTKQTWIHPAAWHQRLESSSISLPSGNGIGPDAARAYCDVLSFSASLLLPYYNDLPAPSVLGIGLISATLLGSLATTSYFAVRVQPRMRRWPGRSLRSAAAMYRSHWDCFVAAGLLAFPIGLLGAALAGVHGGLSGLDPGLGLPYEGATQRLADALGFVGMQATATTIIVVAATVMIAAVLERGGSRGEAPSLDGLLVRLPAAVFSRAVAVVVIGGLCLSLIGIPLAVRLAVRWAFLEEAVLYDGATWRSAFRMSSEAAGRSPLRVAGMLALLGLGATLFVPASGIALLLAFKSAPLAYLNLLTSVLYALLVPFIALVLSRLYLDLGGRNEVAKTE
jgi:hypothetical protein